MATMTELRHIYGAASAARLGDCKSLQKTLDQFPGAVYWTISDKQGQMTLLHLAAENKKHQAVKLLLDNKANPLARNRYGVIALSYAIEESCNKCFKLLLPRSIPLINARVAPHLHDKKLCQRPLWSAASYGFELAIKELIEAGADPNLPALGSGLSIYDTAMQTPEAPGTRMLMEAVSQKQAETLQAETPTSTRQGMRRTL